MTSRVLFCQSTFTFAVETLIIFMCIPNCVDTNYLQGHRQQLGKHRDPIGHIEILQSLPSPTEFWDRYASQRRPVLFKGAASQSRGMHLWTDEFLLEHFGNLKVKIESKAEKEHSPSGAKGLGQDTIENFLASYQSKNSYIVSQLPHPLASGVSVLPFLTCGTFRERILEANLWMSSGGTKSLLHRDADNAINCLYAGTKDWVLIHPSFEDRIPIAKEDTIGYGGFALLDPDDVDLEKYPAFADVDWTYANVTAGDCLFLPYGYWHQVRSYGSRNMAVSVLFSRLTHVDLSECHDNDLHFKPLSEVNMVYTYDGYSDQTMGDTDPFELNETLIEWCHSNGELDHSSLMTELLEEYDLDWHVDNATPNDNVNAQHVDRSVTKKGDIKIRLEYAVDKVMKLLDTNHDDKIVCAKEVNGLSLTTLKILANILDGDSANTEEHEFFSFSPDEIRKFLLECMHKANIHYNGELHEKDFLELYVEIVGGSEKGGREVFAALDEENNGFISKEEIHYNMKNALLMYSKLKPTSSNLEFEREIMEESNEDQEINTKRFIPSKQDEETHPHEDL